MAEILFTVFTPIYNRKHTIHRVWNSLINQTEKNFEWLIINDGSNDGVEVLLDEYKQNSDFSVRVYHQENRGKHIAFNRAVQLAKGSLMIVADSDDSFVDSTVETFNQYWQKYKNNSVSGITVLCTDEKGEVIGDKFPKEGVLNQVDIFYKYFKNKRRGEHWGCIRIDLLKKHPFPEVSGAKFFPESYVWEQLVFDYDSIFVNKGLRTYFQDSGNQLTKDGDSSLGTLKVKLIYGIWWLNQIYPKASAYLSLRNVLKRFSYMWKVSFLLNEPYMYIYKQMENKKNKFFALLTYIPTIIYCKIIKK